MKFLSLLIGVFALYLSVAPCCGEVDSCLELQDDTEQASRTNHDTDTELPCSPFYSCGACLGFVAEGAADFILDFHSNGFRLEAPHSILNQSTGHFSSLIKPPSVFLVV